MISTRQLIFIINIVYSFVNPAISAGNKGYRSISSSSHGKAGSSSRAADKSFFRKSQCFQFLFNGKDLNDEEDTYEEDTYFEYTNKEDKYVDNTSQNLEFCKYELYVAFQKEDAFDNFLHAFLYLKNAEIVKQGSIYTYATSEYYYDLLCTANEMNKPYLKNPHDFCEERYENKDACISDIEKIGCEAHVGGIVCVKNLYFSLNLDAFLIYYHIRPTPDTEGISDEDLEQAVTRGIEMYPSLSEDVLLERLSDKYITMKYYNEFILNDDIRRNRRDPRNNIDVMYDRHGYYVVDENYYITHARNSYFGIDKAPYKNLYFEHKRRKRLLKRFSYHYIMYLYEQLQQGNRSQFMDREQFCTTFLSRYPNYFLHSNQSAYYNYY